MNTLENVNERNYRSDFSNQKTGLVAGIGFLMSFVGAIAASLFIDMNAATSPDKIMLGVFGYLVAILGDVIRAWALYVFFKQVNKNLALLSAWFMLLHDAIFGAALLNLVFGSVFLANSDLMAFFDLNQLNLLMNQFSNVYTFGFQIGLFFFCFHLGLLGYLVLRSGTVPKILGILLMIASSGYLINSIGKLLSPGFPEIIWTIFMGPCLIGELAIVIWLVFKTRKSKNL